MTPAVSFVRVARDPPQSGLFCTYLSAKEKENGHGQYLVAVCLMGGSRTRRRHGVVLDHDFIRTVRDRCRHDRGRSGAALDRSLAVR
jgi:hypothetical protein